MFNSFCKNGLGISLFIDIPKPFFVKIMILKLLIISKIIRFFTNI
jgi:hypothetical protein